MSLEPTFMDLDDEKEDFPIRLITEEDILMGQLMLFRFLDERSAKNGLLSALDRSDEPCSICYEELGDDYKITKCGHSFHDACICTWIDDSPAITCPCCRIPLYFRRDESE